MERQRGLWRPLLARNRKQVSPDRGEAGGHRSRPAELSLPPENAQEDFLVLSGRCRLLANEQERPLKAWDFVHCPPGVSHVFVGDGEGPCVLLMIGHRPAEHELYYPASELARKHGAETAEPTADPRIAYRDVKPGEPIESPEWPRS